MDRIPEGSNQAPEISFINDQYVNQDESFLFTLPDNSFYDLDQGDELSFTASSIDGGALPAWLNFDEQQKTFSGTPDNSDVGVVGVLVTATDQGGLSVNNDFNLTVENVNDRPRQDVALLDQVVEATQEFSYTIPSNSFSDIDTGDELTYSAKLANGEDLLSWLSFDSQTQRFFGTPPRHNSGDIEIEVSVSDKEGLSISDTFTLNIISDNVQPTKSKQDSVLENQTIVETHEFSYTVPGDYFSDPDSGDELSYSARLVNGDTLPDWLRFESQTRRFLGTPPNNSEGSIVIEVTATDTGELSVSDRFTLSISEKNFQPIMESGVLQNQTVVETHEFSYAIPGDHFSDPDLGDELSYSARLANGEDLPAWLTFDAQTQRFSGAPPNNSEGTIRIEVIATDTGDLSVSDTFTLQIVDKNFQPEATDDNAVVQENGSLSFGINELLANDYDPDFSALSIVSVSNAKNGVVELKKGESTITFIPQTNYFGPAEFDYTVSDGDLSDTATVDITVTEAPIGYINGSNDNDYLTGRDRSDVITGEAGDDTLIGGRGHDVMSGGPGNDKFIIEGTDSHYDKIDGGQGHDELLGGNQNDTFRLHILTESNSIESIDGGEGTNTLAGTDQNDSFDLRIIQIVNIDHIDGWFGNDILIGSPGSDILIGGQGQDLLRGEKGDDVFLLTGSDHHYDVIDGGEGLDSIRGDSGNDIFRLNRFTPDHSIEVIDGKEGVNSIAGTKYNDHIDLSHTTTMNIASIDTGGGHDTVIGTQSDDVIIGGVGVDIMQGRDGDDSFIIVGSDEDYDVISGGSGFDSILGSDGDDTIRLFRYQGEQTVEIIDGGKGSNTIAGSEHSDMIDLTTTTVLNINAIELGEGHDVFLGTPDNENIHGGRGNDTLNGRLGSDSYHFGRGDGQDVIRDYDASGEGTDVVLFGENITAEQLWFQQQGDDLVASIIDSEDQITFDDWYADDATRIEQFVTSDGYVLVESQVQQLVSAMAGFNPPASGEMSLNDSQSNEISTAIAASWHKTGVGTN